MTTEVQHLHTIYHILAEDVATLTQQLAAITVEGRAVKQQLGSDGHLDLGTMSESLESFANIEANNRQIDTLNARYDSTVKRLQHAQLLLPQAYFAKLTLDYGDGEPEAVYFGKVGYADKDANDLIYDWRAPVGDAYYANRTGATTYCANGREIPVTIVNRRQFVIDHDQLLTAVDTATAVTDQLLLSVLAEDRSGGLQEITATIQAEQNAIIRETTHPVVIVDGVAGSGKTSVMLQRVAFQLYQHRSQWSPETILLFTPNKAFRQYIRGVLPALGEQEPISTTYPAFIQQLGTRFGLSNVTQAGNHLAELAALIQQPLVPMPLALPAHALAQTAADAPLISRLQAAWRWLAATKQIPDEPATWLDWDALAASWHLSKLTAYDKLYLLITFTTYHQASTQAVYVDEAQDYDADVWALLSGLFAHAEFTIVGDHRQRLNGQAPKISHWFADRSPKQLQLTTSYRATGAITKFFAQYAGEWQNSISAVQAAGLAPMEIAAVDWSDLTPSIPLENGQSLGIITPDQSAAEAIAKHLPDANLLAANGGRSVSAGINVMALAVAKGLEFDHVILTDWDSLYYHDPTNGMNRRYVAASRGTKSLTFVK